MLLLIFVTMYTELIYLDDNQFSCQIPANVFKSKSISKCESYLFENQYGNLFVCLAVLQVSHSVLLTLMNS